MFSVVGAPPTQGASLKVEIASPVAVSRAEDRAAAAAMVEQRAADKPAPSPAQPGAEAESLAALRPRPDPDAMAGPKPSFERSVLEAKLADGMRLPPLLPPDPVVQDTDKPDDAAKQAGRTGPAADGSESVGLSDTADLPPLRPDPTEKATADVALLRSLQATGGPASLPLVDRTS